jgi:SAM-dependent methyltransferase
MSDIITGNYFDKYGARNPLVRFVVGRYLNTLYRLLEKDAFSSLLDAGCGEGEIVQRIVDRYSPHRLVGVDLDPHLIARLNQLYPEHQFTARSLTTYLDKQSYDVVLCLEVLEHIPEYRDALSSLAALSARRYIISVPNEPFFRAANLARLKYLRRIGNTPGHVNNFSYYRFRQMLREAFPGCVVKTRLCYIWTFGHVERMSPMVPRGNGHT